MSITIANCMTGLCEAICLFVLFDTFLICRTNIKKWQYIVAVIITAIFIDFSNAVFSISLTNIGAIVVFEVAVSFLFISNFKTRVIIVILSYTILLTTEMIVLYMMTILVDKPSDIIIADAAYRIPSIIISKSLCFAVAMLIRSRFKTETSYGDIKFWILFAIMFSTSTLILYTFCRFLMEVDNDYLRNITIVSSVGIVVASGAVLYLYAVSVKQNKELAKNEISKARLDEQVSHYENIMMTQGEVKRLNHDLKNHFEIIKSYVKSNEPDQCVQYIDSISASTGKSKTYIDTGNIVLDALINTKKSIAEEKGIDFELNILISENLPILPEDQCAIFGNLLDNAIEGCERCMGEKYITLMLRLDKNKLVGELVNSCQKTDLPFKSTEKTNIKNHGIGIISVRETLKKYNAVYRAERSENEYKVSFVIHIPNTAVK